MIKSAICALTMLFICMHSVTTAQAKSVQSYQDMKNANVVKQQFDNSCGSASLATILTYFYGAPISEKQVMDLIGKDAKTASFADLARVATQKGFGARGMAMNFPILAKTDAQKARTKPFMQR